MALDRHMHGGEPLRSEADMREELEARIAKAEAKAALACRNWKHAGASSHQWMDAEAKASVLRDALANLNGGKS
jgi:hypothetical protein